MKHVDLSIGSMLGLAGYVAAPSLGPDGNLLAVRAGGRCSSGLAVGIVNGVLVATLRLPSLVVTLGTLYVVQGLLAADRRR